MKQYRTLGLGGTFDHFHVGHKHFLQFAASLADKIFVGITVPELTTYKEAASFIESFETRKSSVEQFLSEQGIDGEVFPLTDTYGPTLQHSKVEAVAVTEHTIQGAESINEKRVSFGLEKLPIHICALLRDNTGELISSTRVRLGLIDRNGTVYAGLLKNGMHATAEQLSFFKPAQGPVKNSLVGDASRSPILIVGDIVSETFIKNKWPFLLCVFDQKSDRQEYHSKEILNRVSDLQSVLTLPNPPGELTAEVTKWLGDFCRDLPIRPVDEPAFLRIEGEEDLVTVGLVILAPFGTRIFYGQPNEGMVELVVTEKLKEKFRHAVGL